MTSSELGDHIIANKLERCGLDVNTTREKSTVSYSRTAFEYLNDLLPDSIPRGKHEWIDGKKKSLPFEDPDNPVKTTLSVTITEVSPKGGVTRSKLHGPIIACL